MLIRSITAALLLTHCAGLLAAEVQGRVTDEGGVGLKGVRICLSVAGAAPGDCSKTRFTDKNGGYAFKGLDAGTPYSLRVSTDATLKGRKADLYPNYAWGPVEHELELTSRSDRVSGVDFTGSFNFSNFQAEFRLTGSDFPELSGYDLVNDYVFLKLYFADSGGLEQDLVFLGQVSDINSLLIEVSAPLSEAQLLYEVYSALEPVPLTGAISLTAEG
jgi:hypothetical protein